MSAHYALAFSFDYGNEGLDLETSSSTTTYKNSGISDLKLAFLAVNPLGNWELRYGMDPLGISLGNNKTSNSSPEKIGNRSSGGFSLTPYVGTRYKWNPIGHAVGAKLSYNYLADRISESQVSSTKTTSSGGNTTDLILFYEYLASSSSVYFAFDYGLTEASKSKDDSASSTETKTSANNSTAFALGGSFDLTDSFSLSYELGYKLSSEIKESVASSDTAKLAAGSSMSGRLGCSFSF